MKYISAFYGKRVKVTANVQPGTPETARRPLGYGRVIPEDQCRVDINFSAWAMEGAVQVSVRIKKSDQSKALAMINRLPTGWFKLQMILSNGDALRIIRADHPQETFRLYPVLHIVSQRL